MSQTDPPSDVEQDNAPTTQPSTLERISLAVSQILTPTRPTDSQHDHHPETQPSQLPADDPPQPPNNQDHHTHPASTIAEDTPSQPITTPPQRHPTFAYPPRVETFFNDDTDTSDKEPSQLQVDSPEVLSSSTRTDFTCPPIEDLTKALLKYARNGNLRKLPYPTDLVARRRHFNTFMDNIRIICNISPWTRHVFDLWPKQVSYSHPFVGTALYNLIFTNISEPCQEHIIDGPPDARTALFTLRRHCAPLTPDHVERTRKAFCSLKQQHQEVATSYLNRIRLLTRDCYHAGIPNSDAELLKRTVRGGSNNSFYAASYQRFDADIRRAELNDLLNIDETRGLTVLSKLQRNYNQHANSTRGLPSHTPHHQANYRPFTPRQQQAFSSIIRPYSNSTIASNHNNNRNRTNQPPRQHFTNNQAQRPPPHAPTTSPRHQPPQSRPHTTHSRNQRQPFRHSSNNNSHPRRPAPSSSSHSNTSAPPRSSGNNTTNIVCNNCGRTGHYARQCTNPTRTPNLIRGPRSPTNNKNAPPRNQQRAFYATESTGPSTKRSILHHQAFCASSLDSFDIYPSTVIWPNKTIPQMEINQSLLDRDYLPTTQHLPPESASQEVLPDDPISPHQRFGPPDLCNWLPDSGATSHCTPVFSDLRDVRPCNVPITLAERCI